MNKKSTMPDGARNPRLLLERMFPPRMVPMLL